MEAFLITIISVLIAAMLGGIGYFLKKIFEKVEIIGSDVAEMKPKLDILWKNNYATSFSPRQLNESGNMILNDSGIKEIIEENKSALLQKVKALNPTNAYDAEQTIMTVVKELPGHFPEVIPKLKDGAFKVGQNPDALLLVGGIYLRNLIFTDLGFSLTDLDQMKVE